MIVYKKVNGRASDLRFEPEGYEPGPDEHRHDGDTLPPLDSLHDAAALDAEAKARHNAPILNELREDDMRAIRAILDGDAARIEAHKAAQAARRARLT